MGMQVQSANEQVAVLGGDRARLQARDQINSDWQRLQAALIKIDAARLRLPGAPPRWRDRYTVGATRWTSSRQSATFLAQRQSIQARTELAAARPVHQRALSLE